MTGLARPRLGGASHASRARGGALHLGLLVAALSFGCSRPAPDATPEGAVVLWLERTEAAIEDRRAARDAYALLGPVARKNLEDRAARASRILGRKVEAHEMLAEGRFGLRFRPKSMTSTIQGDEALVEVRGQSPDLERATVRCRLENGGWRVEPGLPDPLALPRRDDGGPGDTKAPDLR